MSPSFQIPTSLYLFFILIFSLLFLDFLPYSSLPYFPSPVPYFCPFHVVPSLSTSPQFKCVGQPPSATVLRTASVNAVYIVTRSDYLQ